ncbi:MAG: nicotinate-nucleotide adenylyltransferase [Gammaproteobacteria bacterium]|nr:nicotinate-nucleotide adenylyltransferase [Gammaproteobacteria bacterium]
MTLRVFYGGTFDPVHDGHLAIARAARDTLGSCVDMMPAADPAHRDPPGADAQQRAAMIELAIAGESGLRIDRRELERAGRSWSIDTARALRAELGPEASLALLVGADSLIGLPGWKDWRALLDLCHFVVAERLGSPLDEALPALLAQAIEGRWTQSPQVLRETPGGRVLRLCQPLQLHSASEIRQRIADGQPWRHLLPATVAGYIEQHGLYRPEPSSGRDRPSL